MFGTSSPGQVSIQCRSPRICTTGTQHDGERDHQPGQHHVEQHPLIGKSNIAKA